MFCNRFRIREFKFYSHDNFKQIKLCAGDCCMFFFDRHWVLKANIVAMVFESAVDCFKEISKKHNSFLKDIDKRSIPPCGKLTSIRKTITMSTIISRKFRPNKFHHAWCQQSLTLPNPASIIDHTQVRNKSHYMFFYRH